MKKKTITVGNITLLNQQGQVLLLKRSQFLRNPHLWGLPVGLVEENESPKTTALRELEEETSIKSSAIQVIGGEKYHLEGEDENIDIYNFLATIEKIPEINLDPREHTDFGWRTSEAIYQANDLLPGLSDIIQATIDNLLTQSTK